METNEQLPAGYLLGKLPFQSLFPEKKFLWRKTPPVPCGRTARKKSKRPRAASCRESEKIRRNQPFGKASDFSQAWAKRSKFGKRLSRRGEMAFFPHSQAL